MSALLAIETSQRSGSIALRRDDTVECEPLKRRHDEDLVAAIDRLLARVQVDRDVLSCVAVSAGPGGFTGLRVGIATAKMLGLALGIPLVAVPTALAVAEACRPGEAWHGRALLVALAVKDERFWATRLRHDGATWCIEGTPGVLATEDVMLDGIGVIAADRFLPSAVRKRAEDEGVFVIEPVFSAEACAAVAARLLAAGATTTPLEIAPIYARPPEVTLPS